MAGVLDIPDGLRARPRDRRGYPVPFTATILKDGTPDFRVVDLSKVRLAASKRLCGLSGKRLKRKEGAWLVGGPVSGFGPHGLYLDPPMAPDNAAFALRTCPYLALPRFAEKEFRPKKGGFDGKIVLSDSVVRGRPSVFVAVHVLSWEVVRNGPELLFRAARPYEGVSFWIEGEMVSYERAAEASNGLVPEWKDLPFFTKSVYLPSPTSTTFPVTEPSQAQPA